MIDSIIYTGVVFMGFSAIMNPLSSMSIFLSLTSNFNEEQNKRIAFLSVLTAFLIVVFFSIAGDFMLKLFNVGFTALRLAGGALVILIGYEMVQGQMSNVNNQGITSNDDSIYEETLAITPLGIPLLAGPGVIITAMNFSSGGTKNILITIFAFGILCILIYYTFIFGKTIKKLIGQNALLVLTKMMGLLLIVIGTQMLIEGSYGVLQEIPSCKYFKY